MNKASIGIAGTPDRMSGLQPLIDIDYPLDWSVEPLYEGSGDFVIELKHTTDVISMRYIDRPGTVRTYQGRPGFLWVGLTIPRGKRFANDVSPFTVLMDIVDTFRRYYMTFQEDRYYEFKRGIMLRAPFDDLLENRYPLEDYQGRYVEMRGDRRVAICPGNEDAIRSFFSDTQYPEFAELGTVVVSSGPSFEGAIKVEIPRPIYFVVIYSGIRYAVLTSANQRFERDLFPPDDVHESTRVSFTLTELRRGALGSQVKVDEVNEVVRLYPKFPERSFKLDFVFRSGTGNMADISCCLDRFFLYSSKGNQNKRFQKKDGMFSAVFVGSEADKKWEVHYDGNLEALRIRMVVDDFSPKERKPVSVTLVPYAGYQGVKFFGARYLKDDAFLEITFSDRESYRYPVSEDSERKIEGRDQSEIQSIRLVSDRYSYPELVRVFDPVSGWDSVSLNKEPELKTNLSGKARLKKFLWTASLILFACLGAGLFFLFTNASSDRRNDAPYPQSSLANSHEEVAAPPAQDLRDIQDPESDQVLRTYVLPAEDAAKLEPYVYLMKNLQSPSGEPLTFEQVKSIQRWQEGISTAAGDKDLGENFNFIKKYIGPFALAVDEINRIQYGAYRGKGWTVEDYYSDSTGLLYRVIRSCSDADLRRFRIVVQSLAIMGQSDLENPRKCSFIRHAVLSNAPVDVKILADVNSFIGILEKYNSSL